ncbi:MAG: hypothetical protein JRI51_11680, partial [Deltaproteobacteria bacterium]|nr:hypothetical protein [Deltaproteobacteria bacterium]
ASTMDMMIPDYLKDYDGDRNDPGSYPDYGSDYLDDIALYARTNDLRSDLAGDQNLILYTVYAFGDDQNAENLLKDAAKNGGFIDRDGDNRPDLQAEWDANNDGVPDTYFKADNGYQLEAKLLQAVNDILRRAASGTAVSVLATTGEGEANLVQAYYRPSVLKNLIEIHWLGYLQSLWVDPYGNLREDTDLDHELDVTEDRVITFFQDPGTGDTKVKRFDVSESTPYPDVATASPEIVDLNEVNALWEAGRQLAQRSPYDRKIFTYLDKDENGRVDEGTYDSFDTSGEVISFDNSSAASLKPYLAVKDDTTWNYLGSTHADRVTNLISYIRGVDIAGLRSRTIDGEVWKLGDIVHSTPISVSRPPDNFHIIYSDESYQAYFEAFKDRETVVYVGANDGMLHAFTSWKYNPATGKYEKPATASGSENIGDELWAYIPQSLLPHLKWLPSPDYTHVYYVDLKPKVFDAKILPDDAHYSDSDSDDNWGTILLCGLNMGGKHIQAQGDFNNDGNASEIRGFYPSYVCMDVTDPKNPRLLWERSYTDLEMTTSIPAIVKVKNKWFAVFGSGPGNYDGTSTKKGHIFVVDLKTGDPCPSGSNEWLFETGESNAYMNSPVSIDKDLNYNVDGIYFGESYLQEGNWKGKLYKLTVPLADSSGSYDASDVSNYTDNPLGPANPWLLSSVLDITGPVTASLALSKDALGNVWIYGGTGRYISNEDKTNNDTQYIFGVKDPFYNIEHSPSGLYADNYYHNYSAALELDSTDLFDAEPYIVTDSGDVFDGSGCIGTWADLIDLAQVKDGWIRSLVHSKERILNKASILGGIVFTPSFVPNSDVCGFGGDSYLYGLYYQTGTAYYKPTFSQGTTTVTILGSDKD